MTDTLRTDIENLPMDGGAYLVGNMKGEVLISRYVHPGRWSGLASTDWPVCWAPVPAHPYAPAKVLVSGERVKP